MKTAAISVLMGFLLVLAPASALAALYKWVDKDGVIHIVDDKDKIPPDYRGRTDVYESTPIEKKPQTPSVQDEQTPPAEPTLSRPMDEVYGGRPLSWWDLTFRRLNDEVRVLESGIGAKRQFTQIYESGRRVGQFYGSEEIATYNRYIRELPDEQKKLDDLKAHLDELKRKARIAGVPREVRE